MKKIILATAVICAMYSCHSTKKIPANETTSQNSGSATMNKSEVQTYLDEYNKKYRELYTKSSEAQWKLNTMIIPGDTVNANTARRADEDFAAFTGSKENIEQSKKFLEQKSKLTDIQVKQLEKILYMAANNPETLKDKVKERIKAETAQTEKLFGFKYVLNGEPVSTNQIDSILNESNDEMVRRAAWEVSKEVGRVLKDGLVNLRGLRNETVQGLGYNDYFTYQVSDYDMTTEEMMALNRKFIKEIWPLYRELHTYARYELAAKYGAEKHVPDLLPAHWVNNRWGQDWSSMIDVQGLNLDSVLKTKSAEWIVKKGEEFYVSLGFDPLPKSFYEKSSLYPAPPNAGYQKNNHASAWHMDLDKDVRSLMSVVPNAEWYETVNHELGHIYYYMTYSNKDVPPLLREGANRAYHEAFGTMIGLAAMQKPFLANNGLLPANSKTDEMKTLLKEALNYIVFIPWSAGVMTEFEHDLYVKNLPPDQFNQRWWELKNKYQGISAPSQRGAEYCDAASKTHINDDAAQYYDYAISFILLFQVHDHIAKKILKQDPHATLYYGNKEVGNFLRDIMYWGGSKDWRKVLKDKTGEDLSARAMLEYFSPLMDYLKKANQGRKYTLPETI